MRNKTKTFKDLAVIVILLACLSILSIACSHGNGDREKDYIAAINENNFERAHEILDEYYKDLIKNNNASLSKASDKYSERYWAAADHIYKAEMHYLLSENDPEANRRMIYTLANMNIVGDVVNDGEIISANQIHRCENYSTFTLRYNRICDEILKMAIFYKNRDMAEQIINLYKQDNHFEHEWANETDKYIAHITNSWTSRDAAEERLQEAINNGELN